MTAPIEPVSASPPHRIEHPLMRQSWINLTFLHWRIDPAIVRPLVPGSLELDLCDGSAWIGLVPFYIVDLTLPRAPSVPWLSHFAETNVRTYVVDQNGRRGVWFFSLDAARLAAVAGARAAYALPYYWARMRVQRNGNRANYWSRRRHGSAASSNIEVDIGEPIPEPRELEVFLTARFRLYAQRSGRLMKADVEHPPWPLHRARAVRVDETLTRAAGLAGMSGEPLAHFAPRVDVLVARVERV